MKIRTLLPLTIISAFFLSGCGLLGTGSPNSIGKTITPEWIQADFDGKAGNEFIATSNLQDVVFNARGEVIGWYIKATAGTPSIKKNKDGTYNFDAFINRHDDKTFDIKGKGALINMVGDRAAFVVQAAQLDPKQSAITSSPTGLTTDLANNKQEAVFKYIQSGATVTKKITLHPRNFKINLETTVTGGSEQVNILFAGLGKAINPRAQAYVESKQPVAVEGASPLKVDSIKYAALQEKPSQTAHALIVLPNQNTKTNVTLVGGAMSLITATVPAISNLEVYGGKNELIHLYQSGYSDLPGLFSPNIFGKISLLIVKLMESLYKIIGNWGLVLMALTILLRLVMWPLMQAQGRSTARMQIMQPKIKEVQDKYKDRKDADSQRAMQAEVAQVYKDYNFNPAGCFSMFLPFPILIALWSTIKNFEFDSGFLWLPDLAIPDPYYILALIYVIVNLGQLYVSTRKTPEMFKQQAMLYLVFLFFALTFPAGVTIYIILSTLIGVLQQIIINRQVAKESASIGQIIEKTAAGTVNLGSSKTNKANNSKISAKVIDAPVQKIKTDSSKK